MTAIVIATRNAHKTREFSDLLGENFEVLDLTDVVPNTPATEETGSTFEENAVLKAVPISRTVGGLVLGDDSGLEVDVLEGAPGIYSARYAGEKANDQANVTKLLNELRRVGATAAARTARFHCALAVARAGGLLWTGSGKVEGAITDAPRGANGFGYDPVFVPRGFSETVAELSSGVKNRISHRAQAIAALRAALPELLARTSGS
jgi:XTP/dITP diphosphohydrolase